MRCRRAKPSGDSTVRPPAFTEVEENVSGLRGEARPLSDLSIEEKLS